jgi:hypothetical protein
LSDRDARLQRIWGQKVVPVVYRRSGSWPLLVRLPYAPDNGSWLRGEERRKPEWDKSHRCWKAPRSWFEKLIKRCLLKFSHVYVIQPYNVQERCAPACWNAVGVTCECSCMGLHHGSGNPDGKWHIVSETCAVRWEGREYSCRLLVPLRKSR